MIAFIFAMLHQVSVLAAAVNGSADITAIPPGNAEPAERAKRGALVLDPAVDRITGIQLFVRVVETGSFSKAASELGITQPTATKHVAALEARLGARLLHRSTRGVTATEVGTLYYEKCKTIERNLEEADNLATLSQRKLGGVLRVNTSVAFGRRVLVPLALKFMRDHPDISLDMSFEDRYVDLVAQGIDVALRMGRLSDSSLGARYLGVNPWLVAASPAYLKQAGTPKTPADLAGHSCLVYSSVQGDDRWQFTDAKGKGVTVPVRGPLRSNNLSAVLAATRAGLGLAALPWYVARESAAEGRIKQVLEGYALPVQELHAVYPSPKLVPLKVVAFIAYLEAALGDRWWQRQL
jgi:DNA-binding transcriptional LysR family regulator